MELSICLAVAARTYSSGRTLSSPHMPPFMQVSATFAISRSVQITPEPPHETPSGVRMHQASGENPIDRKSTRLNSSHVKISYAVFCLKKKKRLTNKITHI